MKKNCLISKNRNKPFYKNAPRKNITFAMSFKNGYFSAHPPQVMSFISPVDVSTVVLCAPDEVD
jgi:hypothetical protein